MQRIKKGDTVEVIAGKDLGERGEVVAVLPKQNRVVVNGVNVAKKHQKEQQKGGQRIPAQIIEFEAPIHLSNVMLVCTQCNQKTRVGFRIREDGYKVRVCKKCQSDIE
jgi:large subunit ribosomal protein L24